MIDAAESAKPSAFSFSQNEIDHLLLLGSNNRDSRMEIATEYSKQKSLPELAAFLHMSYRGGYGLKENGRTIAAWYSEDGIHLAPGRSARYARTAQIIPWEQAAERIGQLLGEGKFATNVELAEAPQHERNELAQSLWYFYRDMSKKGREGNYLAVLHQDKFRGFPEETEHLTAQLEDPQFRSILTQQLEEFRDAYRQDRELMRFHFHKCDRIYQRLTELELPRREYQSDMTDMPVVGNFITEDEINADLTRGGDYANGTGRIYEFFLEPHSSKEKADYLKNEYGTGGHAPALSGSVFSSESHDAKGIRYQKQGCEDVRLSWKQVAARVDDLISRDRYLTEVQKQQRQAILDARAEPEAEPQLEVVSEEQAAAWNYHVGDTVYLDDTEFRIEQISDHEVQLRDPTLSYPIFRAESKERLAQMLDMDERNNSLRGGNAAEEILPEVSTEPERRYLVAAYHHFENGFDDKLDYKTLEEAEKAAQGYVDGTMEHDGFQYDGAAVYDQLEHQYIRIYGDYPDEKAHAQVRSASEDAAVEEPKIVPEQFIDHFYVAEDLKVQGALTLHEYATFEEAFQAYQRLPTTQTKALGIQKQPNPLPGILDIIQCLDGTDTVIRDYQKVPEWQNEEILSVVQRAEQALKELQPPLEAVNYRIMDDNLGEGGPKLKYARNVAAIRTLFQLEAENRNATPREQEILSNYVGWGGLADVFDPNKPAWAEEYRNLKELLSDEEYAAARASTLNAHYTSLTVIRGIYDAVERMGFETGNILEPAMGVGNFFGLLPEAMRDSRLYGVELDSITGRIAQKLYPKADITVAGFETTDRRDFYDLAVGNVPFGNYKVADKPYDKLGFSIHNYFFAKTLDQVRPGGVIAFVTSRYTMDSRNPDARQYIAQRADLLGAIRLPNDAFKKNAGTEVVSDILFLQKRDHPADITPDWVHLNTTEDGFTMNSYFVDHPEMVLGELSMESTQYGKDDLTVNPIEGADLADQLKGAVSHISGTYTPVEIAADHGKDQQDVIPADPNVKNYSYAVVNGEVYFRENSVMRQVELNEKAKDRVKGMVELRGIVNELIEYQLEDYPDERISQKQAELNDAYDAFTAKHGLINNRANGQAFSDDSSYYLLCSLENVDEDGNLKSKADMFTKRTIRQKVVVTSVDTASEALALSLAERARVDMDYMTRLTGKTEEQIYADLQGVIFLNPDYAGEHDSRAKYLTADEYLSGNVRAKLAQAQQLAEHQSDAFSIHVQALQTVQPKDLSASEISVRLGATWLPPDVVESFMYELFGTPHYSRWRIKIRYSKVSGEWSISDKNYDRSNVKAANTYGTTRINGYRIIEETLNLKDVRIFDYIFDESGKKTPVLNKKETAIAQGKQEMIKQAFQDWIWKDPNRRDRLCRLYNEKFNSLRPREYDGSHLKFVGMNPEITLRPHQVNAIAHILYGGNTLLAHVVGAGKTFEMVAAAMESKRLGLCQKSLFVVPNHLTEQWASEFLQLYPSANILVATKKDFEAKNRKRFCGRIATGDYDAIIIGHSQFEKIPMSVERQRKILQKQIDDIVAGIAQAKQDRAENFTIKQMERSRKQIQAKLEKLNDQSRKDDLVTFEELGVDRIFVDEAHYYKNLAAYSKMRNVGGISQTEAQKSSDLYMKCRYLDEITGGRGIIFATGTPISNSMVEMYTLQRYLQYDLLESQGLLHFDAWASTFGETVTAIELAPEGSGYRAKTRFARFYNLPELMSMFKEVADIQTADMLKLPVPRANFHSVVLKPSEQQKEMVASLSERAERVRNKMVNATEDNMLLITNDGRKLALDQRLMSPMLGDSETSKANACADAVYQIWQETTDTAATQLVFCDLSTPTKVIDMQMQDGVAVMSDFQNIYDDIRKKLIGKGIPEEQIAFIHSANTEAQKKELFGKVRSGQIRVLLGSTQKMGAGTNVQQRLRALHHLDCPWRPSDLQQREGRIVRQGNMHDEVDIYTYVTENTFDSYLYQLVESKQKFIGQIMTSKSPVRSAEDIDETALSYAEIKALCTGNPYIKEKMDLDIDVQRLRLLKANHLSQRYALEDRIIKEFPQQIRTFEQMIAGLEADIAQVKTHTHPNEDGFSPMVIENVCHSSKKAAGSAILEVCHNMTSPDPIPLGRYRGFDMKLHFDSMKREFIITLQGELSYPVALGTDVFGNIQRLDNAIDTFPERLQICRSQLENVHQQLEAAKAEVQVPFPKEEELKTKSARLEELNILLNLDKKENEIVDGEISEEEAPTPKTPSRDR